ncbi:hypothetical protein [Falsarthrobacter nasiphocae]|uniref:Peptidoglycan binding-like domain-containing protein n=1 Tax=Falsarthrobacter nasiphocae TaxID=189863 RepID=A0AAE4C733_9MICC|nr:hypothetical protein [Falsarthrobacter nasiphocae]MDR6892104.1 hypothetical protein [Falsarthrobacter nasiphocae]
MNQNMPELALTAQVETGALSDEAQGTATSIVTRTEAVSLPAKEGARFTADGLAAGSEAGLGRVLAEVNERPVIVLQGPVAAYRTLSKGATGRDVAQLQQSLAALGYESGLSLGTFDDSTARGLAALFRTLGYPAVSVDGSVIPAERSGSNAALVLGEGYFAPVLPVKAAGACGTNRLLVEGPLCEVTTGAPSLIATIPTADAQRIKGHENIRVVFPDGKTYSGALNGPASTKNISNQTSSSQNGTKGAGGTESASQSNAPAAGRGATNTAPDSDPSGSKSYAIVLKDAPELPAPGSGDMPLTVIFSQSEAESLLVPSTAIRAASGTSWVEKESGARVDVTVGLCVQGRCVVRPASASEEGLSTGESVIITGAAKKASDGG